MPRDVRDASKGSGPNISRDNIGCIDGILLEQDCQQAPNQFVEISNNRRGWDTTGAITENDMAAMDQPRILQSTDK